MKYFDLQTIRVVMFMAATTLSLNAAGTLEADWNQVCRVANGRELLVTTTNGELLEGYCLSIDNKELAVTTRNNKVVKIARATLSRLEVHRAKGHQLRSLGMDVRQGLHFGFESVFSEWAPLGIVAIPATLAWGAVATPFCLLGDLRDKALGKQEIKLH